MSEAATDYPEWMETLANCIATGDVLLFATAILGFLMPGMPNPDRRPQLEPWQVVALRKFRKAWRRRFEAKGRISIKAGHGVGKTVYLSILILFVVLCGGEDVKIPVVSVSQDQLRDALWPEVQKWRQKLPPELQAEVVWEKEKIYLRALPEGVFAVPRTASKNKPEALQGMHATTLLAIFEEASGIPEETMEAGAGSLSTPGALAVAVGNPTRRMGFFYRTHTDPALVGIWDRMTVNSEDVPRARGHIDDIIRLYGKDSNRYRVRVLGLFPEKDDDVVIPLAWAESAKGRDIAISHVWPVWGCDAARFGDDRITLIKRQGNTLLKPPLVWRNLDGPQVTGRIVKEYLATPIDFRPRAICVDVIGYGASVVDHLKLNPTLIEDEVDIIGVNVAESAAIDDRNHRLRDELWWLGREWFHAKDCTFPKQMLDSCNTEEKGLVDEMIAELTVPTYDFTSAGKRIVASKKDMKTDTGRSPDLADGFLLTFAAQTYPRPVKEYRKRWEDTEERSAWGA